MTIIFRKFKKDSGSRTTAHSTGKNLSKEKKKI